MQPTRRRVLSSVTLVLLTALWGWSAGAQTTERVSVTSGGTEGNGASLGSALSADGRFVAFDSAATDLVAGDTNGATDVFVHDRQTGTTERVSVASGGTQANNISSYPALSADGRFVAFQSDATNLVAGDTNGATDVFVHDRQTGATERVSVASGGGTQGNRNSGGFFAFPALSVDGRLVAFHSTATNLVSGDANGAYDVFVHELTVSTTTTSTTSSSTTRPPTTTSTTTQPTTTTTTTRPTTTTLACEPAQLAEDSLAGVECAIGAVRATLNSPPQPACECKHCSLEPVLERIAAFVMQADGATRPKKCKRNLGKAGRAAKALRARVASMTRRNCLAPADRVTRLDSEVVDLARRTRALFKSRFCASTLRRRIDPGAGR